MTTSKESPPGKSPLPPAPPKRFDDRPHDITVIGNGTTRHLPGDWRVGGERPLTPERADERPPERPDDV